jgi:GMP synthase (glutamine-hydrolysing)
VTLYYMITIWQHGDDEAAGEIGDYLTRIQEPFETIRLFETRTVPKDLPSHLIILGGKMSVNDTRNFPFFSKEQHIIREMVATGRPVLGICLGAQMIAASFGEQVYPSTPERGWCRITGCNPEWRVAFPEEFTVFHWHDETFNLPKGATFIARGDTVKNQIFKMGSAVGVQFHPEVTRQIISRWSGSLQKEEQNIIRSETDNHLDQGRKRCRDLVDAFMRGWA